MADVFKGFLVLRLFGFLALVIVVAVVLGVRSLVHGSDIIGIALLAGAVLVGAGAIAWLRARHARAHRPVVRPPGR
jgi:hypothetical protein